MDNLDHLQRQGLWDIFPTARALQQTMVDEPTAYSSRWSSPLPNDGSGYGKGRTPWEIKEAENQYKPGMTKNDVIKAQKVVKQKDGQENGVLVEDEGDWSPSSYGSYSSRTALPENVEFEKIKAEVGDGVLYITIPKPARRSKTFDISVQ